MSRDDKKQNRIQRHKQKPKQDQEQEPAGISRRLFLGGAAVSTYLLGCSKDGDYWDQSEAEQNGDETIVRAAIHPGIGIARIGNSVRANSDGMFIGPEVVEPNLTKAGDNRDNTGAIKRQAARFRIYGYNAAGEIVRELTADHAEIAWEVTLANKKAAWYRFTAALDLPEAADTKNKRRNASVTGDARKKLIINGGTKNVSGRSVSGQAQRFDGGNFNGTPVVLGELRTDDNGRLLVLGGLGRSASPTNQPIYNQNDDDSFNNADGWFDDTSDGPVTATVKIAGRDIPVEPAWVVVAPPNYAPDVIGWRTMHDLLVDTYVEAGMLTLPATTSFTHDVLPALRRLSNLQWVNKGFSEGYRRGTQFDFDDPSKIAKLAKREGTESATLRKNIQESFRPPGTDRKKWPWLYGDAYGSFEGSVHADLGASTLRALHLKRWAEGTFVDDWEPGATTYRKIEDVPLGEQPAMLDRAALHFCLADAFHPGCELTWPMRHASLYSAPFRIKAQPARQPNADYGDLLTAPIALKDGGPLHAQSAGDLTRWMALPWQGDTVFCRSGYEPEYDPHLPTFWPARVPNHVLSEASYQIAMDTNRPRAERVAAFRNRESWVRSMKGAPPAQMLQMVKEFGEMGIVAARKGPANDPDLPSVMFVESLPLTPRNTRGVLASMPSTAPSTPTTEAGWDDEAQLEAFRRIRVRGRR